MIIDVIRVAMAARDDMQNGTTRKTVETLAKIASGWISGLFCKDIYN